MLAEKVNVVDRILSACLKRPSTAEGTDKRDLGIVKD
jgi:hypothetical protein